MKEGINMSILIFIKFLFVFVITYYLLNVITRIYIDLLKKNYFKKLKRIYIYNIIILSLFPIITSLIIKSCYLLNTFFKILIFGIIILNTYRNISNCTYNTKKIKNEKIIEIEEMYKIMKKCIFIKNYDILYEIDVKLKKLKKISIIYFDREYEHLLKYVEFQAEIFLKYDMRMSFISEDDKNINLSNKEKECFDLLEIKYIEDLNKDLLKKKYRLCVKKYHPDVNSGIDKYNFERYTNAYKYLLECL